MNQFTVAEHGDLIEKDAYEKFARIDFPSYEKFWIKEIVLLTNRDIDPSDIHFKDDLSLKKIGKDASAICIAQLHYTLIRHLWRSWNLNSTFLQDLDIFQESFAHISAATDVADELLERFSKQKDGKFPYAPWNENDGQKARRQWRQDHGYPLQHIRDYRNRLIHGRMIPNVTVPVKVLQQDVFLQVVSKIGEENAFQDWRVVTSGAWKSLQSKLATTHSVATEAWKEVVSYCNTNWKTHLL